VSYLRLLAWLTALIITLGAVLSMLPRETRLPSSPLMYPNLDTHMSKLKECVKETRVYPDVDSLNLYIDFDENEIKPGGARSSNESLLPVIKGITATWTQCSTISLLQHTWRCSPSSLIHLAKAMSLHLCLTVRIKAMNGWIIEHYV